MNRFEYIWWWITNRFPKRFGNRVRSGKYYDRFYNPKTKKKYLLDKLNGKVITEE